MKHVTLLKSVGTGLLVYGVVLMQPFSIGAQETTPGHAGKPTGEMGMHDMMGKEHMSGMMAEMQQRHEQMEKMHQEMTQELQKQMTALRDHTKAMEGMTDEKQLFGEMKKHQQMTDGLLGTMLDQREKMHTQRQAHHERMRSRMGKTKQPEKPETEGHEAHH